MTSEYVNLGTKPNVDISRDSDFLVKSVKDDKMNNYKDINHCEIDLFSSSNLTKTDSNKFIIEETQNNKNSKVVNRNKESWDTEQISKQLYPVHENNLDFLVESPGDDSKNSNENNETKIKETNYNNYNKVSKGNYNDTITSTFSNNYTNKIANQNRTIFNLENLKQIMSIENFENTNKNMIDLTNRNMVNSYLSNKNNLETEKKEFLKKLMYFSNKNNSVINNISPSNSIAPNSKNISPKRKNEETIGEKFVDEMVEIKNPFNIYAAEINLFDEENKTMININDASKKPEEKVENGDFFLNKRKNKHSINVIKNRLLSSNILNSYDESILDNYNSVDEKVCIKKKKISKSFSQKNEECIDKEENTNLIKKDIKNQKTKINEKKSNKNEKNNSKINDLMKSPNNNVKEKKQNLNDKEKNKNPTKLHQSNLTKKPNISKVQHNNSNLVNYLKKSMLDLKKVNKKEQSKFREDIKSDKNNNGTNNGNIEAIGVKKRIILSDINSKISSIDDKSNTLITSLQIEPSKKHNLEIESNNYEFKSKMRTPNSHSLFDYANFSIDILDDGKKKRQNYVKKYRELNRIFSNTLSLLSIII